MVSSFWEDREDSVSDSESTEGSSDCDLSSEEGEEEELTEEEQEEGESTEGYIVISSDEELMYLETPTTPQTPLTPGARLELTDEQEWSEGLEGESPRKDQNPVLLDPLLELHRAGQSPCMQGKITRYSNMFKYAQFLNIS